MTLGTRGGGACAACTTAGAVRYLPPASLEVCDGAAYRAIGTNTIVSDGTTRRWSNGSFAASCKGYRNPSEPDRTYQGATGDGLYTIDPDGSGPGAPFNVYCDQTTEGGGWILAAKFGQTGFVNGLALGTYNQYFNTGLWIEGTSMALPTSPTADYSGFRVESVDWRRVLTNGQTHSLRQTMFKSAASNRGDFAWDFTYNGVVKQNGAAESARAWALTNRRVLGTDGTGITWNLPVETVRFWLPFQTGFAGNVYTACGSYGFEAGGCAASTASARRFGNAGVIGAASDSNDPGASWAPHMNADSTYDIIFIHQASAIYGTSGSQMTLLYWLK